MNFRIENISICNLRSITSENSLFIDLDSSLLTILDGPNGYGKTTFFDAIELLFTGNIRHFFSSLYNKNQESLSSVANNINKDTIIKAEITIKDKGVVILKRTFDWKEFAESSKSKIEMNSLEDSIIRELTQDELFEIFGISQSIFNIGMYISQNDSLEFLKLKYKERKDAFSAITGTDVDNQKIQYLDNVKSNLTQKKNEIVEQLNEKLDKIEIDIIKYKKMIDLENENEEEIPYERLFEEKEYNFDLEKIIDYSKVESYLSILSKIEKFLTLREDFENHKRNEKVNEVIKFQNKFYKAIYYKKDIRLLKEKEKNILLIKEFEEIKNDYLKNSDQKKSNQLFKSSFEDSIKKIEILNQSIKQDESKLSSRNLQKNKLIEARENLKKTHKNHYLKESTCPYCGKEDEKLMVLFDELSNTISENESELSKHITEKRTELQRFIENEFNNEINEYIGNHQKDIDKYDHLSSLFKVDTTKFEENLKELDLSINLIEETNPFDEVYSLLIEEIKGKLIPVKEDFNNEVLLECEHISNKYFDNEKSKISVEDVHKKKTYLIQTKNRLGKNKMKENETLYAKTKLFRDDVEKKIENKISEISELRSIYQNCIHNYNSEFLRDVKVPLFVISGRIMQTAPIGLGIEAKIDNRRVEFLSGNVEHDVTNMLSAGQLNGLMISILLAVQKTYLSDKGVKLFMIDDPLQTIDDLSGHSFVDLLTQEFSDNQIFISTHELEKTAMFYYKYDQAKISFTRKNLQLEYLNN